MKTKNNIILDNNQINHKIRRIALQILESNIDEQEIILAGIIFLKSSRTVVAV